MDPIDTHQCSSCSGSSDENATVTPSWATPNDHSRCTSNRTPVDVPSEVIIRRLSGCPNAVAQVP